MNTEISILIATAASLGLIHTLLGPDHYVPFVVMARARGWDMKKTALITSICGLGHVASSICIGFLGILLGVSVSRLAILEGARGNLAAWALIAFGLTYLTWGLHRAQKSRKHSHWHSHEDGTVHDHAHSHAGAHAHVHDASNKSMTPWILFTLFVFGPCEPLIPMLMYPAAQASTLGVLLVVSVFGAVTIGTMLTVVLLSAYGFRFVRLGRMERYAHAMAGGAISACGAAIVFLGV